MNNRRQICLLAFLSVVLLCGAGFHASSARAQAQPGAPSSETQKKIEAFIRNYFALGTDYKITVNPPKELGNSGLLEVSIDVKSESKTSSKKK